MINTPSMMGALVDRAYNGIFDVTDTVSPTNGTSGTGVNVCGTGSIYTNSSTGQRYVNLGTKASPQWNLMYNTGHALYDFAVDGGAVGVITPSQGLTLPNKAIIIGGLLDIVTTLTSGGAATIAIGTSAGSSATSLKAATAVATYAAGLLAIVPVYTAASAVKMTAAGNVILTVATAALTAGKMGLQLTYVIGD